ncbi:hypothetical protein GE107_17775 [Cohnella sp. CFH 77786]|uniref:O-antigen ligase family protein n=1 Tax=Cohnella sp. CFH 77786 TaxID=2662265 RepID=UPI001C60D852|nr:O-antigen ligase family protein [Cohnella sp. CFH 77786]MBW5447906.1 hypothetical protein [Cohnella sp. CFH 77786]
MEIRIFVRMAGTAGIAGILGWAAWRYGLFFDSDAYAVELVLFALAAAVMLAGLGLGLEFGQGLQRYRSVPFWPLLPLGMAACYGIGLLSVPASYQGTVDSMLRWTAFAGWLTLLTLWWRNAGNRAWGEAAIQASGVFLLLGGWLGWFGWLPFPEIVLRFDDPELSAAGARLGGFLQYPNAYGAVMAFFLLRQWQGWAGGGKAAAALASLTAVPYAGALVLTESRGALAALLAGLALGVALAGQRRTRIKLVLGAAWTVPGGFAAARGALRGWNGGGMEGAWLTVAAVVAGASVLYGLWRWLEQADRQEEGLRKFPYARQAWISGAALLLLCGAIMAGSGWLGAAGRISGGHYGTAASRLLFYRDAWRMFLDSPWIGFGGDSWRTLFGLYQSEPYVGGEVHSGYLEILLDTGLLGLAVFAGILIVWVRRVWERKREALAPAAVLLGHAAVDFDLSYAGIWLLLLAWFALFAAEEEERPGLRRPGAVWVAAGLLAGASAWGAWAAWHGDAAARAVAAADRAAAPAAREAKLREALAANPANGRIRVALAPLLPQAEERESVLAAGLRYEPQSAPLVLSLGLAEAELGRAAQAEARLREALRLERFSRETQTAAIAAMTRLAETLRFRGDSAGARSAAETAVSFYEEYRRLVREVAAMRNPANGRRFAMTSAAEFGAAKAYAELGRINEARVLLRQLVDREASGWKEQAEELLRKLGDGPG